MMVYHVYRWVSEEGNWASVTSLGRRTFCFLIMMDLHPILVLITQEFEGIAYMLLGDAWVNGTSTPWPMELAMFDMLSIQAHRR